MNKMQHEEYKKSAKRHYFGFLKPIFAAVILVFLGIFILTSLAPAIIITLFFSMFAFTVWGIFFASEIMYIDREYQWSLRDR